MGAMISSTQSQWSVSSRWCGIIKIHILLTERFMPLKYWESWWCCISQCMTLYISRQIFPIFLQFETEPDQIKKNMVRRSSALIFRVLVISPFFFFFFALANKSMILLDRSFLYYDLCIYIYVVQLDIN